MSKILTTEQVRSIELMFDALSQEVDSLDVSTPYGQTRIEEIESLVKELSSILRLSIDNTKENYSRSLCS